MSDTYRQQPKGKREVYRRSDSRQELDLLFTEEFHRQPMKFTQQWCYMVSLSFLLLTAQVACSASRVHPLFFPDH